MKKLILLLLIGLIQLHAFGINQLMFHKIDVRSGLSDNYVKSIIRDKYGFMWMATSNGIDRYDGYQLKKYTVTQLGSYNNDTNYIIEDAEGTIWVRTIQKLYTYDRCLDKIADDATQKLSALGIDRSYIIIGIGGGIVCDITGFVAHIYMRGVRFGLVPTTLLSLADAAIGGKNGVNYLNYKNMIGSFDNPDFIVANSDFVQTLPEEQYMSGLGEIIKYALIGDSEILKILTSDKEKVLARYSSTMQKIIAEAINTKVEIVKQDPTDKGIRHILNFGHTIGHSIEITENIPHGIAVVKGMNAATDISVKCGLLCDDKAKQIKQLLSSYGYDISYHLGVKHIEALANDKKKENSNINFVLLEDIGKPTVRILTIDKIAELVG